MRTLTLEQLIRIHALVRQETGGSSGIRDIGRLEAAIATQTQIVFDEELYPEAAHKAAAIIRVIIADHPFVDGNKRSALLAGLTFLHINGIHVKAKTGEVEDFAVEIAVKKLDVPKIAAWLDQRIKRQSALET